MSYEMPTIELNIERRTGDPVSLKTVALAAEALQAYLAQIARDASVGRAVEFVVTDLSLASAHFEIAARSANEDAARTVISRALAGLQTIESGESPAGVLSYRALDFARQLSSASRENESISLGFGAQTIPLGSTFTAKAQEVLIRRHSSTGSVTGKIETLSIHEFPPYFTLFHSLDGHGVKCRFTLQSPTEISEIMNARARARVHGRVQRRFDGRIETVDVVTVERLRSRDELPQVGDIRGLFAPDVPTSNANGR